MPPLYMDSSSLANSYFDQNSDAFVYSAFGWRRYLLALYVLIAVLAGWGLKQSSVLDELQLSDNSLYGFWRVLVRYVVPTAIALVFVVNL